MVKKTQWKILPSGIYNMKTGITREYAEISKEEKLQYEHKIAPERCLIAIGYKIKSKKNAVS